jgi:hypothetical protein
VTKSNLTIVLILFLTSQTCIIAAGFLMFVMIGEVNRKVPEEMKVSYLFSSPGKYVDICRQYRNLYPDSHVLSYHILLVIAGFLLLIGFGWRNGIF